MVVVFEEMSLDFLEGVSFIVEQIVEDLDVLSYFIVEGVVGDENFVVIEESEGGVEGFLNKVLVLDRQILNFFFFIVGLVLLRGGD